MVSAQARPERDLFGQLCGLGGDMAGVRAVSRLLSARRLALTQSVSRPAGGRGAAGGTETPDGLERRLVLVKVVPRGPRSRCPGTVGRGPAARRGRRTRPRGRTGLRLSRLSWGTGRTGATGAA